jgi:hypothetical protein
MSFRQLVLPDVINDPKRDLSRKAAFHLAEPRTWAGVRLARGHFGVIKCSLRRPTKATSKYEARMGRSRWSANPGSGSLFPFDRGARVSAGSVVTGESPSWFFQVAL